MSVIADSRELLYNTVHSTNDDDGRWRIPLKVSFKDAQEILCAHTTIAKDKISGLKFRTVKNKTAYNKLFNEMNTLYSASVGMHLIFWPCGQALVKTIKENEKLKPLFENKRVLGLCSGSGLSEIFIAKNCRSELVVASDHDIFARAICKLNAELNDIDVGTNFVVSNLNLPDLNSYLGLAREQYRLYDTVLCSDFRYAVGKDIFAETLSYEILGELKRAAHKGADVLISDIDYATLYQSAVPWFAKHHKESYPHDGLTDKTIIAYHKMDFDKRSLKLNLEPRQEESKQSLMPVFIHHWPAQQTHKIFSRTENIQKPNPPRLDNRWWQPQLRQSVINHNFP